MLLGERESLRAVLNLEGRLLPDRFDSDKSGDREVQRTMLELLNQLDGFSSDERIKVSEIGKCSMLAKYSSPFILTGHRRNKSDRHS